VAFEVRHKVEHTNGRVDQKFIDQCRERLANTSWADRPQLLQLGTAITITGIDVKKTYEAMTRQLEWLCARVKDLEPWGAKC